MSQFDKNELVSLAEICYENGRYEDVISYMKEVIKMGTPLNFKERGMLFYSYRELMLPYINSITTCDNSSVEAKLKIEISQKAKSETNRICVEAIELLDSYWIKRDTSNEAIADYKRGRAFILMYKAVTASEQVKSSEIIKAMKLLEEAYDFAVKILSPAHPVTILNASNFSDLQHLRLVSVGKALAVATEAYNKGLSHLHEIPEELKIQAEEWLDDLNYRIDYLKQQ